MGSTPTSASSSSKTKATKAKSTVSKAAAANNDAGPKKSAQQAILEVLAQAYSLGRDAVDRDQLTMGTGLKLKTIQNNLPKLKQQGLIEVQDKMFRLTAKGLAHVGDLAQRPSSNAEHQANMIRTLGKPKQVKMFELLANGGTRDKDEVARILGYDHAKVKAFQNLIGEMRNQKKMVEYPDKKTVRLTDACFIAGRGDE